MPTRFRYKQPVILCPPAQVAYVLVPKSGSNSIKKAIDIANRKDCILTKPKFYFTFVRHPLDRLVSAYVEKIQGGKIFMLMAEFADVLHPNITIDEFVNFLLENQNKVMLSDHFCPQSWLLQSYNLDFVGHLEDEDDWKVLMDKGLPELPHMHKTKDRPSWKDLLHGETLEKACEFYQDDFEMWPRYENS